MSPPKYWFAEISANHPTISNNMISLRSKVGKLFLFAKYIFKKNSYDTGYNYNNQ